MPEQKRGLGRGLGALIPTSETISGAMEVPVESLRPSPHQPRRGYDAEALSQLADSIRTSGVIQPVLVSETPGGFQIIAGERRWRAAQMAGLSTIPVIVRKASPRDGLILAMVENLQREDLDPLEAATGYQELIAQFGLTQEEVAERVGRSRAAVANTLRLLKLPEEIKKALAEEKISEGHGRALLGLEGEKVQLLALKRIIKGGLNVRQAEELVRRMRGETPLRERAAPRLDPHTQALEQKFREALGTKVQLFRSKKGGKLIIYFFSEEDLQGLYDRLVPT